MSHESDGPDPPSGPTAQLGAGVASLVEAWMRDTATYAVVLLGLAPAAVGTGAGGVRAAVGVAVGAGAAVAAVTPTIRGWPPGRTWRALLAVAVLDLVPVLVEVAR